MLYFQIISSEFQAKLLTVRFRGSYPWFILLQPRKMAKSSRSKSERRSKAILYARVFKPVEEARTARLSAKLHSIPTNSQYLSGTRMEEDTTETKSTSTAASTYKSKTQSLFGKQKKGTTKKLSKREVRNSKAFEEFDGYGLSKKELRF